MHRVLVDEKRWVSEERFLHALGFCMLLPGPEAMQLATYVGWLLHRTAGGLVAGTLFVLPGFASILALSFLYALGGGLAAVQGLFLGIKPAVLALVLEALVRIGRRALCTACTSRSRPSPSPRSSPSRCRFPGSCSRRPPRGGGRPALPGRLRRSAGRGAAGAARRLPALAPHARRVAPALARARRAPRGAARPRRRLRRARPLLQPDRGRDLRRSLRGPRLRGAAGRLGFGWLTPGEMLDGLGLAETTPGPLIQVVQFVGFLAAWRAPGALTGGRRRAGVAPRHVGHLRALLPLDLRRRALRRAAPRRARRCAALSRASSPPSSA